MAKILEMPKLSPTMEEGVLSSWHKKEGDNIEVDDLLAEVETDKATMEFRAFDKGTLLKLLVPPGANVKLGQPVAIVGNAGEDVSALAAQSAPRPEAGSPAETPGAPGGQPDPPGAPGMTAPPPAVRTPAAAVISPTKPAPPLEVSQTLAPPPTVGDTPEAKRTALDRTERERDRPVTAQPGERVMASPYVRKTARDLGIDLQGAHGSGPGGRIVPGDLEGLQTAKVDGRPAARAADTRKAPANQAPQVGLATTRASDGRSGLAEPEVRPLSMMRKTIARRLTESKQTVPHFYLSIDVDVGQLVVLRERINADLAVATPPHGANGAAAASSDAPTPATKVSINDLLLKACAGALVRVPECNAQFTPEAILVHRRVDISVAVAIAEGLVTPVVRNADQKSVVAIAREVRELAARARSKKLAPEEMTNGTFSISNLGMFGVDSFSAVINPPEGAILAVGQIRDVPLVRDGAVVAGKMLALTLSCDHRVVDGAVGAAFLAELRSLLEHPMRILTG